MIKKERKVKNDKDFEKLVREIKERNEWIFKELEKY